MLQNCSLCFFVGTVYTTLKCVRGFQHPNFEIGSKMKSSDAFPLSPPYRFHLFFFISTFFLAPHATHPEVASPVTTQPHRHLSGEALDRLCRLPHRHHHRHLRSSTLSLPPLLPGPTATPIARAGVTSTTTSVGPACRRRPSF